MAEQEKVIQKAYELQFYISHTHYSQSFETSRTKSVYHYFSQTRLTIGHFYHIFIVLGQHGLVF